MSKDIFVYQRDWDFMCMAAEKAGSDEVGGFAFVKLDNNELIVDGAFLVPQEISMSEVDYEDTDAMNFATDYAMRINRINELRVMWHSHGPMKPFPSNTDMEAIEKVKSTGIKWFVNLIINKNGDFYGRIDQFGCGDPYDWIHYELDLKVLRSSDTRNDMEEQYKRLVKRKYSRTMVSGGYAGQFGQGYGGTPTNVTPFQGRGGNDDELDVWWDHVTGEWVSDSGLAVIESTTVDINKVAEDELKIKAIKEQLEPLESFDLDWWLPTGASEDQMTLADWEALADMYDLMPDEYDYQDDYYTGNLIVDVDAKYGQ